MDLLETESPIHDSIQEEGSALSDIEYIENIRKNPRLTKLIKDAEENARELLGDLQNLPEMQNRIWRSVRKALETNLEFASVDYLTGLPNRMGFERDAHRLLRLAESAGLPAMLLSVDLDGFKGVNDNVNHQAGDQVLREFADLLRRSTRTDADAIARLGGDEFKILAVGHEVMALMISQRLLAETPSASRHPNAPISSSIGVAFWQRGESLDALDIRSEHALQWAKHEGKNQIGYALGEGQQFPMPANRPALTANIHEFPLKLGAAPQRNDRNH